MTSQMWCLSLSELLDALLLLLQELLHLPTSNNVKHETRGS